MTSRALAALLVYAASTAVFATAEEVTTRIVGGDDVEMGRYPYFVSLVDSSDAHQCGGSLIAPNLVLTSASCLSISNGNLSSALVGFYSPADQSFEKIPIIGTFTPDEFNPVTREFDLMIVQLASASTNQFVTVNSDPDFPRSVPATILDAIGYGRNSTTEETLPSVVQEIDQLYISNPSCFVLMSVSDAPVEEKIITPDKICITDYSAFDGQCFGDLGGPIVLAGESAESDQLLGVLSWSAGCFVELYPSVGMRTSSAFAFIKSTVCGVSGNPPEYFDCPDIAVSQSPTVSPTPRPSPGPTVEPTRNPTSQPVEDPTPEPSSFPTATPTFRPTTPPSLLPTSTPTFRPTTSPSVPPTPTPTLSPSAEATIGVTSGPSVQATVTPTPGPTNLPSAPPTTTEPAPSPLPTSQRAGDGTGTTPGGLQCISRGLTCSNSVDCCTGRCALGKCQARVAISTRVRLGDRGGEAGRLQSLGLGLPLNDRVGLGP